MARNFLCLIFLILATVSGNVDTAEAAGSGIRLYSDVCLHEEAGDVLGTRIAVLDLEDGPYVMYQEAEGAFGKAQIVKLEAKGLSGSRISFLIEGDGKIERFRGSITAKQITGSFDDHRLGPVRNAVFHLSRVVLPQKGFPACR